MSLESGVLTIATVLSLAMLLPVAALVTNCSLSVTNFRKPQPLLLIDNKCPLPDRKGHLIFKTGSVVEVACPGTFLSLGKFESANASCSSRGRLTVGQNCLLTAVRCRKKIQGSARYTGNKCGGDKYKEIEIGFKLKTRFIRQIVACFDQNKQTTLYTAFNLTSTIFWHQKQKRPSFFEGNVFSVKGQSVNALYRRDIQRKTINRLLGLPDNSQRYIKNNKNYFLARGHLAANIDFTYAAQQTVTFCLANAIPQWQSFNAGNWLYIEKKIREYATKTGKDLEVYTGTYGVSKLPHGRTGAEVELYLFTPAGGNYGIPVPQLMWKIVYHPEKKAGIVLLGVNNPYDEKVSKNIICTDISSTINWPTWNSGNLQLGYSYACSFDDFIKKVDYSPRLDVTSVLKLF